MNFLVITPLDLTFPLIVRPRARFPAPARAVRGLLRPPRDVVSVERLPLEEPFAAAFSGRKRS